MTIVYKSRLNAGQTSSAPRKWEFPKTPDLCCIYRVPHRIRQINPKAYTPQLVILGPLHHSLKAQASKRLLEDIENTRFMGYLSMEQHKKMYLLALEERFGTNIIDKFKNEIKEEEEVIRASYSESTTWIESPDFVEMILLDSVFILVFIMKWLDKGMSSEKTGDILMDKVSLNTTVQEDLILLENQLPFFILKKLFDPIIKTVSENETFGEIIINYFGLKGKMNDNSEFKHFTDLLRCVRVDSPELKEGEGENKVSGVEEKRKGKEKEGEDEINSVEEKGKLKEREGQVEVNIVQKYKNMEYLYNAEKLHCAGIKFKVIEEELSLDVKFENGCLEIPVFVVEDGTEMILRNIMALEQCHYPYQAHVCSYMFFLDYIIDTDKDVDILVEKGIIKNWMGDHGLVADMVNKLSLGMIDPGSRYYDIACRIEAHYKNEINKLCARLKRIYFSDLWTGTATSAAIIILLLTVIQAITSLMQFFKEDSK